MNQDDFFANLIEYSKAEGFSFLNPGGPFEEPRKLSAGKQAFLAAATGAAFGLVGTLSSGYLNKTNKEELIGDLTRMNEYCDVVGVKLSDGSVIVRLGLDADNMSNEALVGRFSLIHERAYDFRKYALALLRNIFSDGKMPTVAQVVVTFSSHSRAKEFTQNFANKCKHSAFWKAVETQPWIADLEDEEIVRLGQPLTDFLARDAEKVKAGLFRHS